MSLCVYELLQLLCNILREDTNDRILSNIPASGVLSIAPGDCDFTRVNVKFQA